VNKITPPGTRTAQTHRSRLDGEVEGADRWDNKSAQAGSPETDGGSGVRIRVRRGYTRVQWGRIGRPAGNPNGLADTKPALDEFGEPSVYKKRVSTRTEDKTQ